MSPRDPQLHGTRAALVAEHLAAAARAAGDEVVKRVVALLTEGQEPVQRREVEEEDGDSEAVERARVAVASLRAMPEQRAKLKYKRYDMKAKMLEEWGLYRPRRRCGSGEE